MNERIKNLIEEFKVREKDSEKIEPYYLITFEMDSNDGDYMEDTKEVPEEKWKHLHPVVLLGIIYFGYCPTGKFPHRQPWEEYYGTSWQENKHGLSGLGGILERELDLMCYTEWGGECHSYVGIGIEYIDENNTIHIVGHPSLDDLFDTEDEMISTIKEAMKDYYRQSEDF